MKKNDITLTDYNTLAYEFAIRNPRVVELLEMNLNAEVVDELRKYGIDATSEFEGEIIYSLQELYLDYRHLEHLKHVPYSPYGEGQYEREDGHWTNEFRGYRKLVYPVSKEDFFYEEPIEDAITRIKYLIEARGGKLQRLLNGSAFNNYDDVTFFNKSVYSIDPSTKTTKTINNDIDFINKWVQPSQYFQLLPIKHEFLQYIINSE